jgi:hypothetical protein
MLAALLAAPGSPPLRSAMLRLLLRLHLLLKAGTTALSLARA